MGPSAQNSSGVHWCSRRVKFNEVPEKVPKVPEKVWEARCRARSRSTRFRRRVQEALLNRVSEKVPEKVGEAFVQSQVRLRSGEGLGARSGSTGFWRRFRRRSGRLWCRDCRAKSGSTGFRRRFRRRCGRLWCRARSGSTGFAALIHGNPPEVLPALGFAARFRKICKIKRCGCWGYHGIFSN